MKRILFAMLGIAALSGHGALAQSSVDTLARIKQAKAINVAYSPDSLPFSMSEANGDPAGYTIDLCKRAIAQIGRTVGEGNLKVNWIPGSVSERLQMIAAVEDLLPIGRQHEGKTVRPALIARIVETEMR